MRHTKYLTILLILPYIVACSDATTTNIPLSTPGSMPITSQSPSLVQSPIKVTPSPDQDHTKTPVTEAISTVTPVMNTSPATKVESTKTRVIPTPTYNIDDWQDEPVIPELPGYILEIYQKGLELGNNPHAFSKIGDCGSTPTWFLGDFDRGPRFYNLGNYQSLEKIIAYYQSSFDRTSLAAQSGFNASSVLTPLWSDKSQCKADETPLACEYRVHKPSIAFITLGANDVYHLEAFEPQMRKIIEYSISQGVIPILSTKPDNIEKNHQINQTIARLAYEYQIPLWNYWRAMQPLPDHGLQEDGVHITFKANQFENPDNLQAGWPVRNLTALQVLDAMRQFIDSSPQP